LEGLLKGTDIRVISYRLQEVFDSPKSFSDN